MRLLRAMASSAIALLLFLSASSSSSSSVRALPHRAGFCLRSASNNSSSSCPNPPTVPGFNLTAYLGRWYEIGSTARFKLLSEAGLRCNQAVYSGGGSSSAVVRLLNSGQKVISDVAVAQVGAINVAAYGVCSAARQACAEVEAYIASNSNSSSSRSAAAAQAAKLAIAELAGEMERIQELNGEINEAGYSADLRENVEEGLKKAVGGMIRAADRAASRLKKVEGFVAAGKRRDGHDVAGGRRDGRDVAAAGVQLAAIRASAAALLAAGRPVPGLPVSFVNGTVAQPEPATSPAKLQVSIGPVAFAAPYWVLDAVPTARPNPARRYSAALVFSCSRFAGTVSRSLFILSRRPNLHPRVVNRFLAKADSLGIYSDCNDPFLFTLQQGGNCGRVLAAV